MKKPLLFLLCFVFSPIALCTSVYKSSIEELYTESSLVVFGQIEEGRILPENCGTEYSVRVSTIYKGQSKSGELVKFEKYGPMQIGAHYFIFMSNQENQFEPIKSTNSFSEAEKQEHMVKCRKYKPAYDVNVWGEGSYISTGTYNRSVPKAVFFDDFMFSVPKELNVTKVKLSERYDNDRRYSALDYEKFEKYLASLGKAK